MRCSLCRPSETEARYFSPCCLVSKMSEFPGESHDRSYLSDRGQFCLAYGRRKDFRHRQIRSGRAAWLGSATRIRRLVSTIPVLTSAASAERRKPKPFWNVFREILRSQCATSQTVQTSRLFCSPISGCFWQDSSGCHPPALPVRPRICAEYW